jgi:MFS family permease
VLSYLSRLVGVARTVSGNPWLLRVELAFVGFNVAEWATWVSILAYAYGVGGAPATGLVAVVQLVPAALVAPFAAVAGDRFRRERVLLAGYLAQAVAMAATAIALLTGARSRWSTAWLRWPRPRSPSPAPPRARCCPCWPGPRRS